MFKCLIKFKNGTKYLAPVYLSRDEVNKVLQKCSDKILEAIMTSYLDHILNNHVDDMKEIECKEEETGKILYRYEYPTVEKVSELRAHILRSIDNIIDETLTCLRKLD